MATYQVKVKYGEERFSTFLIKDISFAKLMQAIKQNCSPLAYLPASNIRVRYRDDMINMSEDPDDFAFGEMLRSAKEVKDRDYGKIFLQASEVDSPLPRKLRRMDVTPRKYVFWGPIQYSAGQRYTLINYKMPATFKWF